MLAAICYPHTTLPEDQILDRVRRLGVDDRVALLRAYVGERDNRRHRPGRAFERTDYRFDVLADYGAFRDLQRHRMLTIEWQRLTPAHGYERPRASPRPGSREPFVERDGAIGALYDTLADSTSRAGVLRRRARVPHPVRDADERSRGDARARAPHLTAGPPDVPRRVPGDAPAHRRAGRPPRDRRRDEPRRPRDATSSNGSRPSAPRRPDAPREQTGSAAREPENFRTA